MKDWLALLSSSVGVSSLVSGALVFFLREWISTRIRRGIEHEYNAKESRLKAELDGNLEGLKAGYRKVLDENQIRFSCLYADQARAAKTLYSHVYRTHSRLSALVSQLKSVPSDPEQQKTFCESQLKDAIEAFNACNAYFQENRILLPEDICSVMDRFLSIARSAYCDFGDAATRPGKWADAEQAMQGPGASVKHKLEDCLRHLLGMVSGPDEEVKATQPGSPGRGN